MKIRNSNHELLRLIAMYMIIFIHANKYLRNYYTGDLWHIFNGLVNGICNTGVTCFILISGYYGIRYDIKKLVKLECMMISYSLLETGILCLVFPEQMQGVILLEQLVKSLFPFISRKYWFYSCYVCLFLLSGYIERIIEKFPQTELKRLLCLCVLLFSILPTLFYFEIVPDNGKGLIQMILIYMVGRYIKKYRDGGVWPSKKVLLIAGAVLWVLNGISHEFPIEFGGIYHHLCKDNSITNLLLALIIFILFKGFSLRSGVVNKASSCLFAVFALNNSLVDVSVVLLKAHGFQGTNSAWGFLALAVVVLTIMVFCLLIGMAREIIFGKCDSKLGEKLKKLEGGSDEAGLWG